ncbi:hypothetical protein HPB51_000157 [Rhipicephalus microplus]|uniref:Fatty acid synthase n=1 Tax=Rhipicephalus microplus TaxID=6941 RepID=A0A9J6EQB4_RHIMP|nr:hypothetical protein HPB51_000157 [Rhipicephalus microplus]
MTRTFWNVARKVFNRAAEMRDQEKTEVRARARPSMTIDTACSSTMVALSEALLAIRSGRCEAAIVGGAGLTLDPHLMTNFNLLGILSKDGKSRPFDIKSNGYVRSETVGAIFLQRYSDARRIYARVINAIANADGFKEEGVPYPSVIGHESLLRDAYSEVNVDPTKVVYVEAHGTGTKAGGIQELEAISNVICSPGREKSLLIGSVKSNMGHSESASAGWCRRAEAHERVFWMSTGALEHASALRALVVQTRTPSWIPTSALTLRVFHVRSHICRGLFLVWKKQGGFNANTEPNRGRGPVPGLRLRLAQPDWSAKHQAVSVPRICHRASGQHEKGGGEEVLGVKLMYVGHRKEVNTGEAHLKLLTVVALVDTLQALRIQPDGMLGHSAGEVGCAYADGCFTAEQALLAAYWRGRCLEMEYTFDGAMAAVGRTLLRNTVTPTRSQRRHCSDLHRHGDQPFGSEGFSARDYFCGELIDERTRQRSAAGREARILQWGSPLGPVILIKYEAAARGLTWEEAERRCPPDVYPACHNAEDSVTVSGTAEAVEKMVEQLQAENVFARKVDSMGVAFHTKYVHHIGPLFRSALEKIIPQPKPRSKRWISTSAPESRWKEPGALQCSAEYHTNNFVNPVLFCEALKHVPKDAILLEIGPHCLLQAILRRAVGPDASCAGLMKRHVDNVEYFLHSLGKLHTLGVEMDLSVLYPPVPWPLPRGTPNIGHLVGWDHSQSWDVAHWKDFPSPEQAKEDVLKVDLEATARTSTSLVIS